MAIDYEKDQAPREEEPRDHRGGLRTAVRAASAAHQVALITGATEQLGTGGFGAASPLGAALEIGDSIEEGLASDAVEERLERFPELRDIEAATGAAARFPELAESRIPATDTRADDLESSR